MAASQIDSQAESTKREEELEGAQAAVDKISRRRHAAIFDGDVEESGGCTQSVGAYEK